jgi:glycerol-3-phosphate dehydrogenase
MVNEVFPDVNLTVAEVDAHYSGVRPLPYQAEGTTGSIPRGHWIESTNIDGIPIDTLIGGKLTTCRALGEETADRVLSRLFVARSVTTKERAVPGSDHLSQDAAANDKFWSDAAASTRFDRESVVACGKLVGSRVLSIFNGLQDPDDRRLVVGTKFPRGFVRYLIETEWTQELEDLVERRLMLTDHKHLPEATLRELASLLPGRDADDSIGPLAERLRQYYGVVVERELAAAGNR